MIRYSFEVPKQNKKYDIFELLDVVKQNQESYTRKSSNISESKSSDDKLNQFYYKMKTVGLNHAGNVEGYVDKQTKRHMLIKNKKMNNE